MRKTKHLIICFAIAFLLLGLSIASVAAKELRPQMITISEGQGIGTKYYINYEYPDYPFKLTFDLTADSMPRESARLGINAYDCDWDSTWDTKEYDMVFVNDKNVGILTGQNDTWNTTYLDVPLSVLREGRNEITIHVGHQDLATKEIVKDSDIWLLTVRWASLQLDGGKSPNAPNKFNLTLESVVESGGGIECVAKATIQAPGNRSYTIEYSLVDKNGASSASNNQIVDSDLEQVSGTTITSKGYFRLPTNAPRGNYLIQATLRDPDTNESLAYTEKSFNLTNELQSKCQHERKYGNDTFEYTAIRQIPKTDRQYVHFTTHHQERGIFSNTCRKCGETFNLYNRKWELVEHKGGLCVCGYLQPGYNPIHSVSFKALGKPEVGEEFVVTVVTDPGIKRLSAVNEVNFPLKDDWIRQQSADGKVIWTRIYKPTLPTAPKERSWRITGYSLNGKALQTVKTNGIVIYGKGMSGLFENPLNRQTTLTYTFNVRDYDNGKPVPNANITIFGQTIKTTQDGKAVFEVTGNQGVQSLIIQSQGYPLYEDSNYTPKIPSLSSRPHYALPTVQYSDVILLSKNINWKLSCNGKSIESAHAQLNTKATLDMFQPLHAYIEARILNDKQFGIQKYELMQGSKKLAVSTDGKFDILNNALAPNVPLSVCAISKNSSRIIDLQIDVVEMSLIDMDFPSVTEDLGFKLPNVLEFVKDLEIKIPRKSDTKKINKSNTPEQNRNIGIEYSLGNEDYTVGLGVDFETKESGEIKVFHVTKKGREWTRQKESTSSWGVTGLIKVSFDKHGVTAVHPQFKGTYASQPLPLVTVTIPIPILPGITPDIIIEGSFDFEAEVTFGPMIYTREAQQFVFSGSKILGGKVEIGPEFKAGVGKKFLKFEISAGFYGKLKFTVELKELIAAELNIGGEVGLYFKLEIGFIKVEPKYKLYPKNDEPFLTINLLNGGASSKPYLSPDWRIASAGNTDVIYSQIRQSSQNDDEGVTIININLADAAKPLLAATEDTLVMVYRDLRKESQSGFPEHQLYFSVLGETSWSPVLPVDNNTLAKSDFDLMAHNGRIYLLYSQAKQAPDASMAISSDDSPEVQKRKIQNLVGLYDIYICEFDSEKGQFGSAKALTNDDYFDSKPRLLADGDGVAAAWLKNTDNVYFEYTENEAAYIARQVNGDWDIRKSQADGKPIILLETGWLGNEPYLAYFADEDLVMDTTADWSLNLLTLAGETSRVEQGELDSLAFIEQGDGGKLTWFAGGQIRMLEKPGENPTVMVENAETFLLPYRFVNLDDQDLLISIGNAGDAGDTNNELIAFPLAAKGEQGLLRLTYTDGDINEFDVLSFKGQVHAVFLRATQPSQLEQNLQFDLCAQVIKPQTNLTLSRVDYDAMAYADGGNITLTLTIENNGMTDVSEIQVQILGDSPVTLEGEAEILSGEVVEVSFDYYLPQARTSGLRILLTPQAGETHVQDNELTIPALEGEVSLKAERHTIAEKDYILYTIANVGTKAMSGTLNLRINDENGDIFYTSTFTLNPTELVDNLVEIVAESAKRVYCEIIPDTDDYPGNNLVLINVSD